MNESVWTRERRSTCLRLAACAAITSALACGAPPAGDTDAADAALSKEIPMTASDEALDRDIARIRAATAAFKSLDQAVAAGYARDAGHCMDNLPHGAMGFHHQNALWDSNSSARPRWASGTGTCGYGERTLPECSRTGTRS
jgi:hypothetical protein